MAKYDYLVVGCGLFGITAAHQIGKKGKSVLVIDKRSHIGGNCYDEQIEQVNVHKYGPHIFRTNDKAIWEYVQEFSEFNHFVNRPKVRYKDVLYSFPINLMTLYQLWGTKTPSEGRKKLEEVIIPCDQPQNLEEFVLSQVGPELYEIFFKGYTTKQWGKTPKELPASIMKRIPIRLNFDDNYYKDKYQGIPIGGYAKMFKKMLKDVEVQLNAEYFEKKEYWDSLAQTVVYTGKIDEYFSYEFGELEYRSLRFESKVFEGDYQGNAVINYTEESIPFTRITEHKHFEFNDCDKTVVTWEYPQPYDSDKIPYYPINDQKNTLIYEQYKNLAAKQKKTIFGGRLATYSYLDMNDTIREGLKTASQLPM